MRNGKSEKTKQLHRIGSVRRETGVTLEAAARQLGVTLDQVRMMENEASDVWVSELLRWQEVLGVSLEDLLCDSEVPLTGAMLNRTAMNLIETTALELERNVESEGGRHLARMLLQQVRALMPDTDCKPTSPHTDASAQDE